MRSLNLMILASTPSVSFDCFPPTGNILGCGIPVLIDISLCPLSDCSRIYKWVSVKGYAPVVPVGVLPVLNLCSSGCRYTPLNPGAGGKNVQNFFF